jgi:hypothetical protein
MVVQQAVVAAVVAMAAVGIGLQGSHSNFRPRHWVC